MNLIKILMIAAADYTLRTVLKADSWYITGLFIGSHFQYRNGATETGSQRTGEILQTAITEEYY